MNNNFENFEGYKVLIKVAKQQDELNQKIKKAYSNMPPETMEKFKEIAERINQFKNSISDLPGLQKMTEAVKEFEKEVRENEKLSEKEFEKKYKKQIAASEKLGRNGWVITQHINPAGSEKWLELLDEGENKI